MHLAVLITNTDESAFAQRHPRDDAKFAALIASVRPNWQMSSFWVTKGDFPADVTTFDGIVITGSPASVLDDAPWIARLLETVRTAYAAKTPLFGACFGHQAIAQALGGTVEKNQTGWSFGQVPMTVETPPAWYDGPAVFDQHTAHIDHVTQLPSGSQLLFSTPHCRNAGFAIGGQVYTTQNHPEMTPTFMAALVEEYAEDLGPQLAERARASLDQPVDNLAFARSIARFFEQAT